MVRALIVTFLVTAFFVACETDNEIGTGGNNGGGPPSVFYVRAKVDGVSKTWNVDPIAVKAQAGGSTTITIAGRAAVGSQEMINFSVSNSPSGNTIGPATYAEADGSGFLTSALYKVSQSASYAAGFQVSPSNPFTITFTELSTTEAKGTFSGDVYENNGLGPAKKTLTVGEFNVRF